MFPIIYGIVHLICGWYVFGSYNRASQDKSIDAWLLILALIIAPCFVAMHLGFTMEAISKK